LLAGGLEEFLIIHSTRLAFGQHTIHVIPSRCILITCDSLSS
jgi:hypothetical protein